MEWAAIELTPPMARKTGKQEKGKVIGKVLAPQVTVSGER